MAIRHLKLEIEICKRLDGAIERAGLGSDRERAAKSVTHLLAPEVLKIIAEQVREAKEKWKKEKA